MAKYRKRMKSGIKNKNEKTFEMDFDDLIDRYLTPKTQNEDNKEDGIQHDVIDGVEAAGWNKKGE